jgi:hypothetical protein
VIVIGVSLILAVLGSLFVAARLVPLSVPSAIGYATGMALLGGAAMFSVRRTWSRITLAACLAIAFGLGAAWLR